MHIGLVIYGDLDVISGGYLYNKQLVNYWRENGHSVTIFSLPWRNYWHHFADNFDRKWQQQLLNAKLDVLIQDELNHPSLVGFNSSLRQQVDYPLVSLLHLLRCTEPHSAVTTPFYKAVERRYLGQMDGLICNSFDTATVVQTLIGKSVPHIVAYPGRDHWTLDISKAEIEARAAESGPLRILYVGNVIKRKGLKVLLEALQQLDPSSWQLTAIGRHDLEPDYAHQIRKSIENSYFKDQIQFVGQVPFAQMAAIFESHQLFVMPSFYEPFGIVYLEAMGAGLPIIASTAGAGKELIDDGESGYLVPPGNAFQIAQYIQKLAHDRPFLTKMGLKARQRYEKHPTWKQTGKKVTAFFKHLS